MVQLVVEDSIESREVADMTNTSPSNLLAETLLGLYDAARKLPPGRGGRPVSFSCVLRWITSGAPGPDGRRVKLEGVRVGGRWLTSEQALARWAERLTPCLDPDPVPAPRTPTQRRKAAERAGEQLAQNGI
jgi:hypothetical protein